MKLIKLLLTTTLLAVISTACSVQTGPQPDLYLKCTKQEEPMGPYKRVYTGENGWEMYKAAADQWSPSGKYQQTQGEFCEVIGNP